MPKYDIFLSYSSRYKYVTAKIAHILEEQDWKVWWDKNLISTQEWRNEIEQKIQECDYFLYMLTPESIRSHYCQKEYNLAVDGMKKFIPVLVHPDALKELPLEIRRRQLVDFTSSDSRKSEENLRKAISNATPLSSNDALINPIFALYQLDAIADNLAQLFRDCFIIYEIKRDGNEDFTIELDSYTSKMLYLHKKLEQMVESNSYLTKLVNDMGVDIQTISGRMKKVLEGSQSIEDDVKISIEKALRKLSQLRWQ